MTARTEPSPPRERGESAIPEVGTGAAGHPPPDEGSGRQPRPAAAAKSSPWWRFGFPAVLAVLVLAIPVLVWAGSRVVLDSTGGEVVHAISDPAAPGWEAIVDPTPVFAVASVDEQGDLDSVTVLSLTGEGNGAVVQVPGGTVLDVPGIGPLPLGVIYGQAGDDRLERLRTSVEALLGVGIPDIDLVQPTEWASLLAPVSPLTINNPDEVTATDGSGRIFPRASIDVPATQIWSYLSARNPGETELNRMVRLEAFWSAWLARVATEPDAPGVVPGEVDSGLGRFVRGLAKGQTQVLTLPLVGQEIEGQADAAFIPQPDEVKRLMAEIVPFPAGPEGTRVRIIVLDGTGQLDHGINAAMVLAAAGGQIDKVGNAATFDVQTTQLTFYNEVNRPRVEALREALGVGEIVLSDEINSAVDVHVQLGADYLTTVGAGG